MGWGETRQPEPCEHCPVIVWGYFRDPATLEGTRAIRLEERRRIAELVTTGFERDRHLLVKLAKALTDTEVRRAGGLVVHALASLLETLDLDAIEEEPEEVRGK